MWEEDDPEPPLTREEVGALLEQRGLDEMAAWEARKAHANTFDQEPDAGVELAFRLIQAAHAFQYHLGRVTKDGDMTGLQARYAWVLSTYPFGTSMGRLWVDLGLSPAAVTKMVQRMRARGHVATDINPNDPRAVTVRLTDAGLAEWNRLKPILARLSAEAVEAAGTLAEGGFRRQLGDIERLDERFPWFHLLRNPSVGWS